MTDIDTMEAGPEFDAVMAVEVMEWKRVQQDLGEEWQNKEGRHVYGVESYHIRQVRGFHPSTDPAADYEVLEVARKWPEERRRAFCKALWSIWIDRPGKPIYWVSHYQPGDYSRAALKTVRATKHQEEKP